MDTLEAIMTRRSVRDWQQKPVPEDVINKLLAAAMQAPSARNEQPWHFIVVTDRDQMEKISQTAPGAAPARRAPLGIMVCGDQNLQTATPGYWVIDCANAAQTIMLAARAEGLGAVWTGAYPTMERANALARIAGLPESVLPVAMILLGYPIEIPAAESRFNPERVHRDRWQVRINNGGRFGIFSRSGTLPLNAMHSGLPARGVGTADSACSRVLSGNTNAFLSLRSINL